MNVFDERASAASEALRLDMKHPMHFAPRRQAGIALTASDAILTNDAAIERVARVLCPMVYGVNWDDAASGMHDTCRSYAYEATSALLGEGE